ncbi:transcription initiation factor TFIID subunit 7-like [Cydia strobilella]|uniref:transcription initiation factor TFIID subunit 7-like n=1 Tax=Cydia strobilella TaxID=1100964 RepID=UPI003005DCD2
MNRREPDYPVELESQFIMRLPTEPAKALRELLKSGDNFKNRLTIQFENDMRHGEVRFDHWLLHAKIVDLPTIIESLKTIDRKSVYKTADICQMMICKEELDPVSTEDESPKKKKDPLKVDKKYLHPHGVTPPTKNIRKRRFRKTLRKKCMEAPEIEKEVKRLLRADNEAVSVTWEVIQEEDEVKHEPSASTSAKSEKIKPKKEQNIKRDLVESSSKVEDIFGGAVSDSDAEDDNVNVDVDDRLSSYDDHYSDTNSIYGASDFKGGNLATQFKPEMFSSTHGMNEPQPSSSHQMDIEMSGQEQFSVDDFLQSGDKSGVSYKLQQISAELEELKQRRQRTQHEIAGLENQTLRQRFQDILQTLNQDIMYKELEYQNLQGQK